MTGSVVITGIGMVTPLGRNPGRIIERLRRDETAAIGTPFEAGKFDCPLYAPAPQFDAERYFPENKTLRLMNREAQMAVVAARLAMDDADIRSGLDYPAQKVALYGSTGMAGMSAREVTDIIKHAVCDDGSLSLERFGRVALRRVRPVLSFRILANMPICFVSIFENIRGPNAVYTPWQGHGAHAVAAGIRAIGRGDVPCALVGGCDVRTRELSFVHLQQLGIFESWERYGKGTIPGEGAVFLVLEDEQAAAARQKKPCARILNYAAGSIREKTNLADTLSRLISQLNIDDRPAMVVGAGDGDVAFADSEKQAFERAGIECPNLLKPKPGLGDLFAASAAAQAALAAQLACRLESGRTVAANCFGHGTEQASFLLEAV
ncbi:MAG: beta-ketoacyl synthase N-terminal-like domain-containing protein [Planctomycetota bacterium]|jgi:3-oxoacyl-[acyl-carrier-protein] synthase II